jgi:hypothetical protein
MTQPRDPDGKPPLNESQRAPYENLTPATEDPEPDRPPPPEDGERAAC